MVPFTWAVLVLRRGNLIILNAGVEGFVPLMVVAGGHSSTIRCAHWDQEVGVALWGVGMALFGVSRCTSEHSKLRAYTRLPALSEVKRGS